MSPADIPSTSAGRRKGARRTYRASSAEPRRSGGGGGGSEELRASLVGLPTVVVLKMLRAHADTVLGLVSAAQQLRLRVVCPAADDKFFVYSSDAPGTSARPWNPS